MRYQGRRLSQIEFIRPNVDLSTGYLALINYLLTKNKCVCPFASYKGSTWLGFIFGNFIYAYGAIPINLTPLLSANFSMPEASPLSTMTASVLNAALTMPAQNFPLPFSIAPIKLTTGSLSLYLNLSNISLTGKFFLQMLDTLINLANFPPGNRKSYAFHNYYLGLLTVTLDACIFSYSSDTFFCYYSFAG